MRESEIAEGGEEGEEGHGFFPVVVQLGPLVLGDGGRCKEEDGGGEEGEGDDAACNRGGGVQELVKGLNWGSIGGR